MEPVPGNTVVNNESQPTSEVMDPVASTETTNESAVVPATAQTPDQPASVPAVDPDAMPATTHKEVKMPALPELKQQGPAMFGYRPPKWASDFDYVRAEKGKGSDSDAKTWLLYSVDRLLKMHAD